MASESNSWIKFGKAIKFDELRRATWLWHGTDSNVMLMLCQTKFINDINVICQDCICARSYGETMRRILLYRVCALNVTGSDTRSMVARQRQKCKQTFLRMEERRTWMKTFHKLAMDIEGTKAKMKLATLNRKLASLSKIVKTWQSLLLFVVRSIIQTIKGSFFL